MTMTTTSTATCKSDGCNRSGSPYMFTLLTGICADCATASGCCTSCGRRLERPTSDGLCDGQYGDCLDWDYAAAAAFA